MHVKCVTFNFLVSFPSCLIFKNGFMSVDFTKVCVVLLLLLRVLLLPP